jgi:hypothetical protein
VRLAQLLVQVAKVLTIVVETKDLQVPLGKHGIQGISVVGKTLWGVHRDEATPQRDAARAEGTHDAMLV